MFMLMLMFMFNSVSESSNRLHMGRGGRKASSACVLLDASQAVMMRDTLAKEVYARIFGQYFNTLQCLVDSMAAWQRGSVAAW